MHRSSPGLLPSSALSLSPLPSSPLPFSAPPPRHAILCYWPSGCSGGGERGVKGNFVKWPREGEVDLLGRVFAHNLTNEAVGGASLQ